MYWIVFRHASLVTEDQARPVTEHKDVQTVELEQSTAWDTDTDTEDDIHLTSNLSNLFPDPNDFIPSSSPTFSFPPLPPTPPELDETETITSSTIIKTAIEVLPGKLEAKKKDKEIKSALKNKDQETKKEKSILKDHRKDIEETKCRNEIDSKMKSEKKDKYQVIAEKKVKQTNPEKKRHKKDTNHHLKVPQVQLQVSSEREIVDSIVVIKNKQEKKEEKLARKSKRRKEKKEAVTTEYDHQKEQQEEEHVVTCRECQEDRVRRRREREMRRSDELGKYYYNP